MLTRCQALSDELSRHSLHGAALSESMCHLKMEAGRFARGDEAMGAELERFTESSEQTFRLCETAYTTIYLKMYLALEPPRRHSQTAKLKASGVPIDPASALNVVESGQGEEATLFITLYNDNATLSKFPPSELLAVPQIEEKVEDIERYYEGKCQAVATYHQSYEVLLAGADSLALAGLQVSQATYLVKECLPLFTDEETVTALAVALEQFDASTRGTVATRREEARNCRLYRDNVSSKFNVVARLRENMLRAYYLSRLRRPSERVAPAF
jgi:hypothetical protein